MFMKKYIPNLLTISRIIAIPIIIFLGINNYYKALIVVAALIAFTDFLDGFLARKWQVTSLLGANLDAIADKLLAIGLLIILIIKNHGFFYVLILECLIGILNLYFYLKKGVGSSLLVGKFKTWIIFITILLGFAGLVIPISNYVTIAIYLTVILQVITLICYILFWFNISKKKSLFDDYVEYYQIIEPIINHPEAQRRKKYPHHIDESVYEHVIRVSYDCYKIGKRLNMDYKSLAIAGLLHDFYEHPWQYSNEKKPFFQNHAFTHAKNAVLNSKKFFGENIITPKIENIMITHMFPLNKKIPNSKEAWLLTLIDKADSIDFILHPIALFKIFCHKEYKKRQRITLRKIKSFMKKKLSKKDNTTIKNAKE